jgi:5-methylthioadenosine/S-adenosylhomocysteine deaminase
VVDTTAGGLPPGRLVTVGGVALYGEVALEPLGSPTPGCEHLAVCGANKFICVAESGGTTSNRFGQTLSEITSTLTTELQNYDAMNLTPFHFSPLSPLVRCD